MIPKYQSKLEMLVNETLLPSDFSHLDHVGVAFEALQRHDFFDALAIIANGIQKLTIRANAHDKFNATITFIYMSVVAERMKAGNYANIDDFLRQNSDLVKKPIAKIWYSKSRITSDIARSIPVLPDNVITAPT